MPLPPGIYYAAARLPHFLIPSTITYATLYILSRQFDLVLPSWFIIATSLIARPILFFTERYTAPYRNAQAAASKGAVLAPAIKNTAYSFVMTMIQNIEYGYPGEAFMGWANECGNAYMWMGLTNGGLYTLDPDHIKAILATQFDSFEKGKTSLSQLQTMLGTGIFNADDELWKFHRTMTRPFFTKERISDFEIYERVSARSFELARERLTEGHSFDFQDLTSRFTLDAATEFLFGNNVDSLSAGTPYPPSSGKKDPKLFTTHPSNIFVDAFVSALHQSALRLSLGDDWPLLEFFGDQVAPRRKVMDAYVQPSLDKALKEREERLKNVEKFEEAGNEAATLLAHLVNHTQDVTTIKDELVNLLVGGRDTTASLLTYSVYMLSRHPEVEERLRNEIYEKVGTKAQPTIAHMREMKFMRAFLNEVLRLYPPVPTDARETKVSTVLPATRSGLPAIYLPKGSTCIYSPLNMQRRTDLWGPDALKFDPDRFLDERLHKYLTPNPFIFCPFNAGPRICLGQQFAYHEATYFLVRLLQEFTNFKLDSKENITPPEYWKTRGGRQATEEIWPATNLTMYVKGGLWLTMKEIKSVEGL